LNAIGDDEAAAIIGRQHMIVATAAVVDIKAAFATAEGFAVAVVKGTLMHHPI
jgi:hypothetical protein